MLPALLHFALARHIREDAAGLGTMFLKPSSGKPQHWSSSLQLRTHRPLLGGSVLRRRPATRSRVCCALYKYRSSAMQHFGCSWEVGLPRAEAELSSLFVALAPSDWDRGTQRKSK